MPLRRFPPPWTIDETAECFIVRDTTGQALGYFYFHGGKSTSGTKRLSKEEARWRSTWRSFRSCCAVRTTDQEARSTTTTLSG